MSIERCLEPDQIYEVMKGHNLRNVTALQPKTSFGNHTLYNDISPI